MSICWLTLFSVLLVPFALPTTPLLACHRLPRVCGRRRFEGSGTGRPGHDAWVINSARPVTYSYAPRTSRISTECSESRHGLTATIPTSRPLASNSRMASFNIFIIIIPFPCAQSLPASTASTPSVPNSQVSTPSLPISFPLLPASFTLFFSFALPATLSTLFPIPSILQSIQEWKGSPASRIWPEGTLRMECPYSPSTRSIALQQWLAFLPGLAQAQAHSDGQEIKVSCSCCCVSGVRVRPSPFYSKVMPQLPIALFAFCHPLPSLSSLTCAVSS